MAEHLWDVEHPYYFAEGNYYTNDQHSMWDSFDEYLSEFEEADIDMNLVIRWDWHADYEQDMDDGSERIHCLKIQMVHQRKAILSSHEIKVCKDDEKKIRKYLDKHARRLYENWQPIL